MFVVHVTCTYSVHIQNPCKAIATRVRCVYDIYIYSISYACIPYVRYIFTLYSPCMDFVCARNICHFFPTGVRRGQEKKGINSALPALNSDSDFFSYSGIRAPSPVKSRPSDVTAPKVCH